MRAKVVLPVPGGPKKINEDNWSAAIARRSKRPGAMMWSCPTNSSRVRGRILAAKGACVNICCW